MRPGVDGGGGVPGRAGGVAQGFSAEELEAFIDAADEGLDADLIGWAVVLVLTVLSPGIATLLTIGAPGSGNFVDRVSVLPVVFVAAFVFLGWGRLLAWTLMRALREVADSLSRAVRTLPLLLVAFLFFFYNAELWQLGVAWTVWREAAVAALLWGFGVLASFIVVNEHVREVIEEDRKLPVRLKLNLRYVAASVQAAQASFFEIGRAHV